MSRCQVARPVVRGLRTHILAPTPSLLRPFSLSAPRFDTTTPSNTTPSDTTTAPPSVDATPAAAEAPDAPKPIDPLNLDPSTVLGRAAERALARSGAQPLGSRRRRAALRSSLNLPFEQLPYQCFQEALAVLRADREEKVAALRETVARIARIEAVDRSTLADDKAREALERRLKSLREYAEKLKILADINDPIVKRKFEDGLGDMNKPIYRYLAEKKWRSYDFKILEQRIKQFHIVPDLLPKFEPTTEVQLYFRRLKVSPGAMVDSLTSEVPPRLRVQAFDKGERLVSVVVVDSDVPDVEADSFTKRCHFMGVNIPLSPVAGSIPFAKLPAQSIAVPWLPAFAHRGAPYHRLSVFVLEQEKGKTIDVEKLRGLYPAGPESTGFSLKSFRDKFSLKPVGFSMFRTEWDENTAAVMERNKIPGAELEFRRTRVHSMKPERKPKGWEARRQGPKYKHLWKYTKRIRGLSNARGWTKRGN